jgi:hypothetical protein
MNSELIEKLNEKYEALDFWSDLIDCTREAGPKVDRLKKEMEQLKSKPT